MYHVIVRPRAQKESKRLPRFYREWIGRVVLALQSDPWLSGYDVKKLVGKKGKYFRVRKGDIRLVYGVDEKLKEIIIFAVDFRGNVY